MYVVNLFQVSAIAAYCFNICSGVRVISNKRDLPKSEEITIESPGYPTGNYESDTIYTWMVTAPKLTEEIYIEIELDVHKTPGFPCYDYLKIEEIKNYKFTLFKQCGKLKENRTARGNKLKITLFSNYDVLTAKGFRLRLKVSKVSTATTITTTSATTSLPVSKTSLPVSKTTKKAKTKTTTTTKTTQNLIPQTTIASITTLILSIHSSKAPSATGLATRKSIKTKISTRYTSSKASQSRTSEVITNKKISLTLTTLHSSLPPLPSTIELDKTRKTTPFITTDFRHTISREKPELLSTKQNAETSTKTTTESKGFILNQEMVILIAAVGVVEVTLIIVGIIAFRRRRQQRKCPMTRRPIETHDHRPVSRKTVCSIANVYDTIPFDEEDKACDENPYKDPSEGVYDTTISCQS